MNATSPARHPNFYVHKLRLEAREGAHIEIGPPAEPLSQSYQEGWIVAKFIAASLAIGSALMLLAQELAR
jgi:hypothetical protein